MHINKSYIHYILTKPVATPITTSTKKNQSQSGVENKLHSNLNNLINHTFRVETNRDKGLTQQYQCLPSFSSRICTQIFPLTLAGSVWHKFPSPSQRRGKKTASTKKGMTSFWSATNRAPSVTLLKLAGKGSQLASSEDVRIPPPLSSLVESGQLHRLGNVSLCSKFSECPSRFVEHLSHGWCPVHKNANRYIPEKKCHL